MTSRIDCEGGKEPIAPEMIGAVFHRVTAAMKLHDIEIEAGAEVSRIVAKKDFQLAEGQTWKDVLLGHLVEPGTFVNVYVHNKTTEDKRFAVTLIADVQAVQAEVVTESAASAEQVATRAVRPVLQQPKIVTGTDGKPLMQNLPPIMGKPAVGEVEARARTFAAQNGGLGRTGRAANGGMAPVMGGTRNAAPRPGPSQTAPKLIKKSARVIERRLPKIEHHSQSRISAPFVSNVTSLSGAAVKMPPPNAVLGVSMPPAPDSDTEDLEDLEETGLALVEADTDEVLSVMIVTGHALALQRTVEYKVPLNPQFKAGIMTAISRALGPDGRVTHGRGASIDIEVGLTKSDCADVLQMLARGRGSLEPLSVDRLANAFRAAFNPPVAQVG